MKFHVKALGGEGSHSRHCGTSFAISGKGRLRVFAGGTADTREEREGVRGRHVIRYVSHFEACTAGRNDKEKLLLKMGPKKLRYKFYQISWQFPKKVKNNRN